MKILIVGTGGVGGYYGAKLSKSGQDVIFLARGSMLEALQSKPLFIESYDGNFEVKAHAVGSLDKLESPELVILATKTYDTDQAITQLAPVVGPNTLILSFQNGVESEQKLIKAFGATNVLGAVSYIGSELVAPGHIVHSAEGRISLGEMDGSQTERLEHLGAIFSAAGINVHLTEDIQKILWKKLLWNVPFNQACAVARASVGELLDHPAMRDVLNGLANELIQIAQAANITLTASDWQGHLQFSEDRLRAVRPSLLQDLERGKRLEHETFGGFVVREGTRLNIKTPVNQTVYHFLYFLNSNKINRL